MIIEVLDFGAVELIRSMGSDLAIVNAAQASFARSSPEYTDRERRILRSLMREEHGVPFEHAVLSYRLRLPLFLAAQFKKHRHGSWSEHSGRYSEMEPLFYVPELDDVRVQVGKPMDYQYETASPDVAHEFIERLLDNNCRSWELYQAALANGVAKEQARLVLPVNTYTTVVWTLNARSLFNVLRLRLDSHAQLEARKYAEAMYQIAAEVIPDTMAAWEEMGHPKP